VKIFANQKVYWRVLELVAKKYKFSLDVPIEELPKAARKVILYGTGNELFQVDGRPMAYQGVVAWLEQKYKETDSDFIRQEIEKYMRFKTCPSCNGRRLKRESLAVTVADLSIADYAEMPVEDLLKALDGIMKKKLDNRDTQIARQLIVEVKTRLKFIMDVGLNYLALERGAPTLSGGEAQRLRLATQLGASLSQVIYVLDEPTIGLHPNDTAQLVSTLQALKEKPNTVIVVEHDKDMMLAADEIIDVGPGAGIYGGNLVAQGTPEAIAANPDSLTGKYLSGDRSIGILNKSPRKKNGKLTIKGARAFNLKNVDVEIPLGQLVCVTGVSGSGKSTLVVEILAKALAQQLYKTKDLPAEHDAILGLENLNKAITIDQSPIGRSPRSNPATYTGVFSYIRDLFTQMPEAKIKGYDAGDFSFNVKGGGRCENCKGDGYVKVEMQFLPDVYVLCEECKGKRYKKEILEVHYKRKNIADILEMTVQEAKDFFSDIPAIYEKLIVLDEVGLGYISLGQPANTLSGGEAQRIKLATELSRYGTGKTLYILDEPTTGLHFEDINKLLIVLEKLVSKGNSVLVIEHNMEVVKNADWVIDLGPGGGVRGGEVVAAGTPKSVAKVARSLTGKYLNKVL
jgi:excinuclease ABC subunit A